LMPFIAKPGDMNLLKLSVAGWRNSNRRGGLHSHFSLAKFRDDVA
jgi:hypothetical protein